jgi:hypothetical protein
MKDKTETTRKKESDIAPNTNRHDCGDVEKTHPLMV